MDMSPDELGFTPVVRTRTHEEVLRKLQEAIFEGRLRPGDRLPGERQLSEMLGVSRASVREALRILEALDIVRARTGSGRNSGSVIVGEPANALANVLALHVALNHFQVTEVLEVRHIMEHWAVSRAAQEATPEDLEHMEKLLVSMESEELSPRQFHELDTEFHVAVVHASGNRLLDYLMRAIRTAVQRRMLEAFERSDDWPALAAYIRGEHRQIFESIRDGDVDAARKAAREHIDSFYGHLDDDTPAE